MSQRRYWNFKDDDATADINRWLTGLIPPGLYFGFDFNPTANMNLQLNHNTTGFKDVDIEEAESNFQGVVVTRQGTVIKEDNVININGITDGDPTNPRIDLVVLTHEYITTAGGATALYSVIVGTPAATPVPPALTNANTQTVIGELYIPANTIALNGAGVKFIRRGRPMFANMLAFTDLNNYTNPGVYMVGSANTNGPAGDGIHDGSEMVVVRTSNIITQKITDPINGAEFFRQFTNNTWQSWITTRYAKKQVDIGPWDMNSDFSVTANHGLYDGTPATNTHYRKIRKVTAIIRADSGTSGLKEINTTGSSSTAEPWGAIEGWGVTDVRLVRYAGVGFAISSAYNDVSSGYNRGWIVIEWDPQIDGTLSSS